MSVIAISAARVTTATKTMPNKGAAPQQPVSQPRSTIDFILIVLSALHPYRPRLWVSLIR
jgi:hypothetical protein